MTQPIPEQPQSWLDKLTNALLREPQNRNHLLQILHDACSNGVLDPDTLTMVEGVIRYSELRVRDILLPRSQMIAIHIDASYAETITIVQQHRHSRYPVYGDNKDQILGILHAKDLLISPENQAEFAIEELLRPVTFVPESKHLNILLTEFRRTKNHMAMVVDEYGGVAGIVTIENVIEQIVGDIEDEFDNNDDAYINKHPDGRYIIKAHIPISEFNEHFNALLPDDSYETLGGLLMKTYEQVPKVGELIKIGPLSFKILNADSRRIKLVECNLRDKQ